MKTHFIASTLLLTIAVGCENKSSSTMVADDPHIQPLPTIDMVIAGRKFTIEVADDEEERNRGLMYRKSMPVDHGMLFVFQTPSTNGFWMKNTYIPLDIIYLTSDGTVQHIAQMYPNDLTPVPSRGAFQYAIELNQNLCERIGLKVGDKIVIPDSVRVTP